METEFSIYQSSSWIVFSENIMDLIIERNPQYDFTKTVSVSISLNLTVLCSQMVLHYDEDGLIAINLKEIIKGQSMKYALPYSDIGSIETPIDRITVVITGELYTDEFVKTYDIVLGGTDTHGSFYDWSKRNWLTWQPQELTMPIWQPQYLSTIKLNSGHICDVHSRLYLGNDTVLSKTIGSFEGDAICMIDVSFDKIWGDEHRAQSRRALCYEVWGEWDDGSGVGSPFMQRYIIRPATTYDRCFIFQNSLGGFDTIIATGIETIKGDGDVRTFISADAEHELANAYTTIIEQNTGYIDSARKARQWKEFLASNNRAVYHDGKFIKIVVAEYDLKHKLGELTSYSFDYRLATKDETTSYQRQDLAPFKLPHPYWNYVQ